MRLKIYPLDSQQKLEFSKVKSILLTFSKNFYTKNRIEKMQPQEPGPWLSYQLEITQSALEMIQAQNSLPNTALGEFEGTMELLEINGSALDLTQILQIRQLLEQTFEAVSFLQNRKKDYSLLYDLLTDLSLKKELLALIDQIVLPPNSIKDRASKTLFEIRNQLTDQRKQAQKIFDQALKKYDQLGFLSADFKEGFMHNRRVLAVIAEKKRSINGVFHGSSETGKISFIEPAAVLEINREIEILEDEERREIFKILKNLTQKLQEDKENLKKYLRFICELDFIFTKAKLAAQMDARLPHCQWADQNKESFRWIKAYHPLLILQKNKKEIVPLNLELKKEKKILIISGPNAGGKTIALKTLGLHQMMLQAGLLVPCAVGSVYPLFEQILLDIGDDQSLDEGLSTYSSRLEKMKFFLKKSNTKTLFLIDEMGTGSDPELGGAMAEVILEKLIASGAIGAVTTHYANIKVLAQDEPSVVNACMQYDPQLLAPLYQLLVGHPGSSFTFEVAEKIGLSKEIIHKAKAKIDGQKLRLDELLIQLQAQKNNQARLEERLKVSEQNFEKESNDYKEKLKKLEEEVKNQKLIEQEKAETLKWGEKYSYFLEKWLNQSTPKKEIIKSIWMQLDNQLKKQEEELLKKQAGKIKKSKSVNLNKLKMKMKVGSLVKLKGQKETGQIIAIENDQVHVRFGQFLKLKAHLSDLIIVL